MAPTPAQLKTECETDAASLGLAAPFAAGTFSIVADLLNAVSQSIDIDRDLVPSWEAFDACVASEIEALSAAKRQVLQMLLAMQLINVKSTNVRAAVTSIFAAGTSSRTALAALQKRKGSRAEQLWGADVRVTAEDLAKARDA